MDSKQRHSLTEGDLPTVMGYDAHDLADKPSAQPAADVKDCKGHRRPMNRLQAAIVSYALGVATDLAVNDFSHPLAYPGLVGAFAITAVLAVTAWMCTVHVRAVIGLGLVLVAGSRMLTGSAFVALGTATVGYGITLAVGPQLLGSALAAVGGWQPLRPA